MENSYSREAKKQTILAICGGLRDFAQHEHVSRTLNGKSAPNLVLLRCFSAHALSGQLLTLIMRGEAVRYASGTVVADDRAVKAPYKLH